MKRVVLARRGLLLHEDGLFLYEECCSCVKRVVIA